MTEPVDRSGRPTRSVEYQQGYSNGYETARRANRSADAEALRREVEGANARADHFAERLWAARASEGIEARPDIAALADELLDRLCGSGAQTMDVAGQEQPVSRAEWRGMVESAWLAMGRTLSVASPRIQRSEEETP